MRSLIDQSLDVHPAAQAPVTAWQWALERLLGAPGSEVRVGFLDGKDQRVNLDLVRRQPPGRPVHLGALPLLFSRFQSEWRKTPAGRPAGVIRFNLFLTPMARKFEAAVDRFRSAAGIVIDLRGNLGGVAAMVMGLAGHFLDQPVSLGELKLRSSSLQFTANPRRSTESGKRVKPYSGPLVILVDGLTASAAEIFAGSLQDIGRATIIGRRTAGEALPALLDRLPDGDVLMHAFADYTTPSGVRLEGRGVHPDVKVAIDRPALLAGRDPALEAALAWVDRRNSRLSVKASE